MAYACLRDLKGRLYLWKILAFFEGYKRTLVIMGSVLVFGERTEWN